MFVRVVLAKIAPDDLVKKNYRSVLCTLMYSRRQYLFLFVVWWFWNMLINLLQHYSKHSTDFYFILLFLKAVQGLEVAEEEHITSSVARSAIHNKVAYESISHQEYIESSISTTETSQYRLESTVDQFLVKFQYFFFSFRVWLMILFLIIFRTQNGHKIISHTKTVIIAIQVTAIPQIITTITLTERIKLTKSV